MRSRPVPIKSRNHSAFFGLCLLFIAGITGCDFINSIKEYLSGEPKTPVVEKPLTVEKQVPAQPAPSEKSAAEAPLPKNVLARVGSWTITVDEFKERLAALKEAVPNLDVTNIDSKRMVLEELIRQQLLVWDGERTGVASQKDIGMAVEEFRRTLIAEQMARKMTENIQVTDDEVQAFYEEQKKVLVEPAQWHVRMIVVDSQLKANELTVELLKGSDFAEMAKQHSIGDHASDGGDLGFITEAPFPEMAGALLPLKQGDISSIFQGPQGYYVVKVEEKKDGQQIPFEKIKDEIRANQLFLKQRDAVLDRIEKLKQETTVDIKEGLL